jgi:hypothetical protein
MSTLIQQLYSQNHWDDIDGVQTIWNFTFSGGYILPGHVKAYYLNDEGTRVDVTVTEDMLIGEFQLQIDSPPIPSSATRFVIYRDTPKDLPLVNFEDGAIITGANLDRSTEQAVFCCAEVLDGASVSGVSLDSVLERLAALESVSVDTSPFGYKSAKRNAYTGTSNVLSADNGKWHYKTDGTAVTVPSTLDDEFMCTIINMNASALSLTMAQTAYIQDGSGDSGTAFSILPRGTATVVKVGSVWLVSGTVEAA